MDEALDEEIIKEFLSESFELLDELDRQFVALEEEPTSTARLASIFRAAHTIKGTSGLLGFHRLEAVTHAAENVLVKLRDGVLHLTPELTSVLLKSVDAVREMLAMIQATRRDGDGDYPELREALKAALDGKPSAIGKPNAPAKPSAPARPAHAEAPAAEAPAPKPAAGTPASASPKPRPTAPPEPDPSTLSSSPPAAPAAAAPASKASVRPRKSARPAGDAEGTPRAGKSRDDASRNANSGGDEAGGSREANVRVAVGLLDRLMNLVGELVLARNQVVQGSARTTDPALLASAQRLNLITTELQEGIMKTRMQAIGSVWTKFPRIVRDLGIQCGKQVRLELIGRDTELDRTVIEAIRDPLTHLVRNSVDHGLESPENRVKAGKSPTGVIVFRAFHEGGMVNIEVSDDGGGIDLARVRAKAIERNLVSAERAARLSERETMQLLFLPGFSTAPQVTNVSGRGVGMDVVKTSVEKIGGTVDIVSKLGEGTSIRVKIPLTLAIIPALIVQEHTSDGFVTRSQRYAIPQVNLIELVRVEGSSSIEYVRTTPVYRLRGQLLPLVFLREFFGDPSAAEPRDEYNIVVLQADKCSFGLVVDEVNDTQEIVVKPLGRELKGIPAFAGATIMGDGRVALILDVFGIAATLGMRSGAAEAPLDELDTLDQPDSEKQALLVFNLENAQRMAMPLDIVDRLEEFQSDRVENAGGYQVIQYREKILSLLHLDDVVGNPRSTTKKDVLHVVVHSRNGKTVGLVVDHIADIVQDHISVDASVRRPGVLGSAVLQGSVTEILDVNAAWRLLESKQGRDFAEMH
jgi:two-component system, chemotaxis family, sensor kinase CheA